MDLFIKIKSIFKEICDWELWEYNLYTGQKWADYWE